MPDLAHGFPGAIFEEPLIGTDADVSFCVGYETIGHRLGREGRFLAFDHSVHSRLLHVDAQRCGPTAMAGTKAQIQGEAATEIIAV